MAIFGSKAEVGGHKFGHVKYQFLVTIFGNNLASLKYALLGGSGINHKYS